MVIETSINNYYNVKDMCHSLRPLTVTILIVLCFIFGSVISVAKGRSEKISGGSIPVFDNEIQNPEFDDGIDDWDLLDFTGYNDATISVVQGAGLSGNNSLKIDMHRAEADVWKLNVKQILGIDLELGKTYRVSFRAKAQVTTDIAVALGGENDYFSFWYQGITATTSTQLFTYEFTCTDEDVNNYSSFSLNFFVGNTEGSDVWLDDISVEAFTSVVTGIELSPQKIIVDSGNTWQLTTSITPTNAPNQNVSWSSSSNSVATVSSTGLVTAISTGSAIITATTQDGEYTATTSVTVSTLGNASVSNGQFDSGDSYWNVIDYTGSETSFSVVQGGGLSGTNSARVDVVNNSNENWMLSMEQSLPFRLVNGRKYKISFMAKAESNRTIDMSFRGESTNIGYWYEDADLTTTPTNFGFTYECSSTDAANEPSFILAFYLAKGVISDVWLDNIVVEDITGKVTGVELQYPFLTLRQGQTWQLNRTIQPQGATNQNVTWTSSNTSIATVSTSGLVTGVSFGSATITVTTADGAFTANTITTVQQSGVTTIANSEFDNGTDAWTLRDYTETPGASIAAVQGAGLSGTNSLHVNVVNTNSTGWQLAVRQMLPFRVELGKTYRVSFMAKVLSASPINVTLSGEESFWSYMHEEANLTTTSQLFSYEVTVSNEDVALEPYFAINFFVAHGAINEVWIDKVKVEDLTNAIPVTGIGLSATVLNLRVGQSGQLTKSILPTNSTNQDVTWSSSNSAVASVNGLGLVSGIANGTATITAATVDGNHSEHVTVYVGQIAPTSLTISQPDLRISRILTGVQLEPVIEPKPARDAQLIWTSSDNSIASVEPFLGHGFENYGDVTIHTSGVVTVSDGMEIAALRDLYENFGGGSWYDRDNWPANDEEWDAITSISQLSTADGITIIDNDVIGVSLYNNSAEGEIPTSIDNLKNLQRLNLNQLDRNDNTFPNITNLTYLVDIALGGLSGPIPSSIDNLVNLGTLSLQGDYTVTIPSQLSNLPNLRMLQIQGSTNLNGYHLPGSLKQLYIRNHGSTAIPDLSNLPNLQVLYISAFENILPAAIPGWIQTLPNLRQLLLMDLKLIGTIPTWLANSSTIDDLFLYSNNLSGPIPGKFENFTVVNLSGNDFAGSLSPYQFGANIETLDLSHNNFSGELPSWIFGGNNQSIDVSYNKFDQFPNDIPENHSLEVFSFYSNRFSGQIPAWISKLKRLQSISGWLNEFTSLPNNVHEWFSEPCLPEYGCTRMADFSSNKLTTLPVQIYDVAPGTMYMFDNNLISSLPTPGGPVRNDFYLSLQRNYLTFSELFKIPNISEMDINYFDQRGVLESNSITVQLNAQLLLTSGTILPNTEIRWYKRKENGTWALQLFNNQDPTRQTFLRNSAAYGDAGTYRWSVSSPMANQTIIYSNPFTVTVGEQVDDTTLPPLYNGIITSARWRTDKVFGSTQPDLTGMYLYRYDNEYQIRDARWAQSFNELTKTFALAGSKFRTSVVGYDRNGNITAMERYDEMGQLENNFIYNYRYNGPDLKYNNQLVSVSGYANKYSYDELGQMIAAEKTDDNQYIDYDVTGKVIAVYSDVERNTPIVKYQYDDRGFRLAKISFGEDGPRTWWYIRDGSGNIISIYEQDGLPGINSEEGLVHTEVPIYGSGKVATYFPAQDASVDYELTDHLGNVRAVLREDVQEMTATMEDSNVEDYTNPRVIELGWFQNLFDTEMSDINMNHTSGTATTVLNPTRSAYLFWQAGVPGNDAQDKAIGPAMAREVSPGDIITAEVFVRYKTKESYTREGITLSVLGSLLGNSFITAAGFDGSSLPQASQAFTDALTGSGFLDDTDGSVPYAYINYIILNESKVRIAAERKRVSSDAGFDPGEEGLPDMHERLYFNDDIVIPAGAKYIYLWVSNESPNTQVWFDDFKINHASTFVAQATDYGVWGDVLREQKSEALRKYRYGYQGQFAEKDDETGWYHFEAREYDPIIGRWTTPDPLRQFSSPYVSMGNNPVNRTDPNGKEAIPINQVLNYYGFASKERQLFPDLTFYQKANRTMNFIVDFFTSDGLETPIVIGKEMYDIASENMNLRIDDASIENLLSYQETLMTIKGKINTKIQPLVERITKLSESNSTGFHTEEIISQTKLKWELEYQLMSIETELDLIQPTIDSKQKEPQKSDL